MTRKNKTKKPALKQNKPKQKQKPFSAAGEIVGTKIGQMFGYPQMKGIGRWLGSGIGSIFGSGDYTMMGDRPNYNVLTNDTQVPKFHQTRQSTIVCHREYIGDITGTAAFNNVAYPLNPGISQTFPWLATVAQNYQEYKFHGLIFEFNPLITDFVTNGAPGVVVMATNYNADAPNYATKQQMENAEYSVAVKPTKALIHGVECARDMTVLPQAYVRTGAPPAGQDLRLYDLGNFQFATASNPVQNLGELWVSYCVEFLKPIMPATIDGNVNTYVAARSVTNGTNPLGLIQVATSGSITATVTGTAITWYSPPGSKWQLTVSWIGTAVAISTTIAVLSGLTGLNYFPNGVGYYQFNPDNGTTSSRASYTATVQSSLVNGGNVSITFPVMTIPTSSNCEIVLTQLDSSI